MESYDVSHLNWRRTGGNVVRSAADLYIGLSPGRRPRSETDDKIKYRSSRSSKILLLILVRVNIVRVARVGSQIISPEGWISELRKSVVYSTICGRLEQKWNEIKISMKTMVQFII
jgi:hypothetical protein